MEIIIPDEIKTREEATKYLHKRGYDLALTEEMVNAWEANKVEETTEWVEEEDWDDEEEDEYELEEEDLDEEEEEEVVKPGLFSKVINTKNK